MITLLVTGVSHGQHGFYTMRQ
ncbi:hypothetical protein MESS2_p120023 [Mesorhizobium metallidurans STM 2683]|uniref:Uncharacterized protein n=1 Tax=Mesorhizobium metallidurans STM 2683 TaxID=1297569 RepID=M5EZ33_9HYPH|nr:hypothetical protein MESS2_p120023 [Mesorhizobium metallidurans STM 2683]